MPPSTPKTFLPLLGPLCLSLGVVGSSSLHAAEEPGGERPLTLRGWLSYGTAIRAGRPDAELVSSLNGASVGIKAKAANSQNQDDGNLNFKRGDTISTVFKGLAEIEFKGADSGALLRIKAWQDSALQDDARPWGNVPNAYAANRPLSDRGFSKLAQFSGVQALDAYVHGRYAPGGLPLQLRLGYQSLDWGSQSTIGGGLAVLNPVDLPATHRPGALAIEGKVPIPALFGQLALSDALRLEGFYQFKWRPSEVDGCGTFFSTADYMASGCDKIVIGPSLSDRARLASGAYIQRAATPTVSDAGQFGVAAIYREQAGGGATTDYGIYLARYHSRLALVSAIKSSRLGTPFLPGNGDGQNVAYFTEYPEGIRMLALSLSHNRQDLTLFGELSYRPDQPLQLNGVDLFNAFASNSAPSLLRADAVATAAGGIYHGYERHKVVQTQFGARQRLAGIWGAESLLLAAEVGIKQVLDLPDVSARRYGRQDTSGIGQVNGQCPLGTEAKQCSNDGYFTASAWGYRLRASWRYPSAVAGIDLTPSLAFGHDVRGWSYDNAFNAGRQILNLGLRADYRQRYQVDLNYVTVAGGAFNNSKDRDYLALSAGMAF
jgi:hypothetical protein